MDCSPTASSLMPRQTVETNCAADAMVTCAKTLGPDSTLEDVRAFFEDDHVQMALVVATDGRLITAIERTDIAGEISSHTLAAELGKLAGRLVGPSFSLASATADLLRDGRRRLAVVDKRGHLLGLLCLKRGARGYCSDAGIRARAEYAEAKR